MSPPLQYSEQHAMKSAYMRVGGGPGITATASSIGPQSMFGSDEANTAPFVYTKYDAARVYLNSVNKQDVQLANNQKLRLHLNTATNKGASQKMLSTSLGH